MSLGDTHGNLDALNLTQGRTFKGPVSASRVMQKSILRHVDTQFPSICLISLRNRRRVGAEGVGGSGGGIGLHPQGPLVTTALYR